MEINAKQWFVMRDLKRPNAKLPAYRQLTEIGMEVFTPMQTRKVVRRGKRIVEEVPVLQDLLFVHELKSVLDEVVEQTTTLQYRYIHGAYCKPMTVAEAEMTRFIHAVTSTESPRYYLPGELTPQQCGRQVRIIGGPLCGYEGQLLSIRGSKVKRLIVRLSDVVAAAVEVKPEDIQLL
jgi:transcription antitermination factor NusG